MESTSEIEAELRDVLDIHDALVDACAEGKLSFEEFTWTYDNFYDRLALDGHESSPARRQALAAQAERIRLHARIREEVLYHLTSEVLLEARGAREAGFIGPEEARARLVAIWTQALKERT